MDLAMEEGVEPTRFIPGGEAARGRVRLLWMAAGEACRERRLRLFLRIGWTQSVGVAVPLPPLRPPEGVGGLRGEKLRGVLVGDWEPELFWAGLRLRGE